MDEPNPKSDGSIKSLQTRFSHIFEEYYPKVLAYSLRRTRSKEEAQDVAGQVFELLWQKLDSLAQDVDVLPWLYAVARRSLANRRRRRLTQNLHRTELRFRAQLDSVANRASELEDEANHLNQAMERLPDQDKELLRLTAWEGLSYAQIGEAFDISANAVAIRLHRARARLRDLLEVRKTPTENNDDQR